MDIQEFIRKHFTESDQTIIKQKVDEINSHEWGVGKERLIKSLLLLSNGSIEEFQSFFPIVDPRDIIMDADMEFGDQLN